MQLTMYQVDAFTNELFKGNSAAVIELKQWLDDSLMLNIAKENNLSETAFLVKNEQDVYHIRWFSPICEIDFCGHATLASAFVLFKQSSIDSITFSAEAIGEFEVTRGDKGYIKMTFEQQMPTVVAEPPATLLDGLVEKPLVVLRNRQAYFAIYQNSQQIADITPKLALLKTLGPYDVVISAPDQQYDFVSRYFWPASGGDEDPVTGSIHCGLAPYWGQQLDKQRLIAYQASTRGGVIHCLLDGTKVTLSGQAVLYMSATIDV